MEARSSEVGNSIDCFFFYFDTNFMVKLPGTSTYLKV